MKGWIRLKFPWCVCTSNTEYRNQKGQKPDQCNRSREGGRAQPTQTASSNLHKVGHS